MNSNDGPTVDRITAEAIVTVVESSAEVATTDWAATSHLIRQLDPRVMGAAEVETLAPAILMSIEFERLAELADLCSRFTTNEATADEVAQASHLASPEAIEAFESMVRRDAPADLPEVTVEDILNAPEGPIEPSTSLVLDMALEGPEGHEGCTAYIRRELEALDVAVKAYLDGLRERFECHDITNVHHVAVERKEEGR